MSIYDDDEIMLRNIVEYGNDLCGRIKIRDIVYNEEEFLDPSKRVGSEGWEEYELREEDYDKLSENEVRFLCKHLGITYRTYLDRIKRGMSKKCALTSRKFLAGIEK